MDEGADVAHVGFLWSDLSSSFRTFWPRIFPLANVVEHNATTTWSSKQGTCCQAVSSSARVVLSNVALWHESPVGCLHHVSTSRHIVTWAYFRIEITDNAQGYLCATTTISIMSNLDWEQRHLSSDDLLYSVADSLQDETTTRHSRFSWWRLAIIAKREIMEEDDQTSFDGSSCCSQSSASSTVPDPTMPASLRLLTSKAALQPFVSHKQSYSIDSELGSTTSLSGTINIEDWPTPPSSAISANPNSNFSPLNALRFIASPGSPTSSSSSSFRGLMDSPKHAPPTAIAEPVKPATRSPQKPQSLPSKPPTLRICTQLREPALPRIPTAPTPGRSSQAPKTHSVEDDFLQCQLAQLRTEVSALQQKSYNLEEALRQTVDERIAVLAQRVAMSPESCLLTDPILDPSSPVLERGRPVTRSGYEMNESGFWEGRPSISLSMLPEIDVRPRPPRPSQIRPIQSAAEIRKPSQRKPKKKASLSLLPSTARPLETGLPQLSAQTRPLERASFTPGALSIKTSAGPMSFFRGAQKLSEELLLRELKLYKIVDIWKRVGKIRIRTSVHPGREHSLE
ncbi:hypothetical protein CERZMDRAFT_83941 [Cercospora zeae-maydis SCOH1-5]|uniref:Uncharacterized protein n=1 Tax=Cercospora zeae-maydis SCOH1-5 TaxID=717836 RepID=A0A6A6FIG0_9PEZI|nr:hypothetical protein CERZMDRAFT_83941 [Cercospora zeae-maydis SCOH1-5]